MITIINGKGYLIINNKYIRLGIIINSKKKGDLIPPITNEK